uniref:Uncharacterized protein n=1 Tax=Tetradesmus obliquus TaxID=3088 RepID=A0A383VKZ1_TETOB|eukprot:jgi/Sobl393_1/12936/SZX65046.1
MRNNNTGPPDAVLYDFPVGWWDHDWPGCFNSGKEINDTYWHKVAGSTIGMHSRHPDQAVGVNSLGAESPPSPLRRVIKIVEDCFAQCSSADCLPAESMPLLAYEGLSNASVARSSRVRALLRQQHGWRQLH